MTARVIVLCFLTAVPAFGGPVVKLDSPAKPEWVTVQADPVLTTLSVGYNGGKWVLVDDGPQCDLRAAADGKTATFAATADGQYRLLVISGEDVHRVKVVRAVKPPEPMPPGPDPNPKPPEPKPPAPADPLVKLLQAGYDADPRAAEAKRPDLLDLIELFRQAGLLAVDAKVTTAGQLVSRVAEASKALGITGLVDVRKSIILELQAAFPEDVPLTADSRKKATDLFARLKVALEQVK